MVEQGFGDNVALIGNGRQRTYKELADWTSRIAHALVEDYGVKPGNRVLIRSANNPAMVACWLAATKAGAVVVNTMPMLRAGELAQDRRQGRDRPRALRHPHEGRARRLRQGQPLPEDGHRLRRHRQPRRRARPRRALASRCASRRCDTGRDDVALLGFTSGTTGEPKATMHFHRDLLIIADGYAKEVLGVTPDDVFVGSPPLAFTFGLGGLAIFPLRFGATATLLETASPREHDRDHRDPPRDDLLHRPDRLPRDAGGDGRGRRPLVAALRGLRRRDPARAGLRGMDRQDRQADARRHRRHRDAAHLHLQPLRRRPPGLHRPAGHRLRGEGRRRGDERGAARHRRPARGARPDRLPLPRRRAPGGLRPRRLEHHRRQLRRRTRTATSTSPPATTT